MNRFEFYSAKREYEEKQNSLKHYGTKGQKWGERHWQNYDGTFNEAGKERYFGSSSKKDNKKDNDELNMFFDKKGKIDYKKYDLEKLKEQSEKLWNEYEKIHEDNWNKEVSHGFKHLDDIRYLEIKMAKEKAKKDKNFNYDAFSNRLYGNTISDEDERLDDVIQHDSKYDNNYNKLKKQYDDSERYSDEYNTLREIRDILYNDDLVKSAKIHSELIDKANEEFEKNNEKIDEKEQMEWAKEEHPDWNIDEYKNSEDDSKHNGLEKEFDMDGNKIKIKVHDNGAFGSKYYVNEAERLARNFKDGEKKRMRENIINALWSYRFNLFKIIRDPRTHRPIATDKQIKYMYNMSKENFTKEMERQILPKLKMVPKDIVIDNKNNKFNFEYKIDGIKKGGFTIPCNSWGHSYDWDVRFSDDSTLDFNSNRIELDDILD